VRLKGESVMFKKIFALGLVSVCALSSMIVFADEELRTTVSFNEGIPTVQQVEEALFPKPLEAQKSECEQLEKAGYRCQSSIPKSSFDSVLITFARGSARLTDDSIKFLRVVGQALQKRMSTWKSLVIEGHADATGSDVINQRLSTQRADAVKTFLQTEYGLVNVESVGRSSSRLKDPQNPKSDVNRRTEFVPNW